MHATILPTHIQNLQCLENCFSAENSSVVESSKSSPEHLCRELQEPPNTHPTFRTVP